MNKPLALVLAFAAGCTTSVLAQDTQPAPASKPEAPKVSAPQPDAAKPDAPKTETPDLAAKLGEYFTAKEPTVIATGLKFTEGPLVMGGKLVICDLGASTLYTIDTETPDAKPAVLREATLGGAGATLDHEGRLLVAHFGGREGGRVTRTESDGKVSIIFDSIDGQPLKSLNDLVVHSSGDILVTEFGGGRVFRVKPPANAEEKAAVTVLATGLRQPNGVTLSPDEKTLYVAEYGTGQIVAFDLSASDVAASKRDFAKLGGRGADGMKVDDKGNLYVAGAGGVWVFSSKGETLCRLTVRGASNICFGGKDRKTLYITAGETVQKVGTTHAGIVPKTKN